MHVSVTLTATSHVRIDDDEGVPVSVSATSVDEADPPDWIPDTAALATASSARVPGGPRTPRLSPPALDTTASAEPSPATCLCSEDPTEEGPVREGMYGPMHWLDDRHVTALLSPYICEGWDTGDYARFADLSGADARRLRSLLPPARTR